MADDFMSPVRRALGLGSEPYFKNSFLGANAPEVMPPLPAHTRYLLDGSAVNYKEGMNPADVERDMVQKEEAKRQAYQAEAQKQGAPVSMGNAVYTPSGAVFANNAFGHGLAAIEGKTGAPGAVQDAYQAGAYGLTSRLASIPDWVGGGYNAARHYLYPETAQTHSGDYQPIAPEMRASFGVGEPTIDTPAKRILYGALPSLVGGKPTLSTVRYGVGQSVGGDVGGNLGERYLGPVIGPEGGRWVGSTIGGGVIPSAVTGGLKPVARPGGGPSDVPREGGNEPLQWPPPETPTSSQVTDAVQPRFRPLPDESPAVAATAPTAPAGRGTGATVSDLVAVGLSPILGPAAVAAAKAVPLTQDAYHWVTNRYAGADPYSTTASIARSVFPGVSADTQIEQSQQQRYDPPLRGP
jgi:hypothetical protein